MLRSFFILLALSVFACSSSDSQNTTPDTPKTTEPKAQDGVLSAEEFAKLLETQSNAQLVDVRTADEFAGGHLRGAKNLDYLSGELNSGLGQLDRERPVMLYCKKGGRSAKSYKLLKKAGFKTVYDLEGGYTEWVRQNLPIEE